jgi:hypothetical protein
MVMIRFRNKILKKPLSFYHKPFFRKINLFLICYCCLYFWFIQTSTNGRVREFTWVTVATKRLRTTSPCLVCILIALLFPQNLDNFLTGKCFPNEKKEWQNVNTWHFYVIYFSFPLLSKKRGTKILTSLSSIHFTGESTVPDFYKAKNATYGISMENNNQATLNQYLYIRMNKEVNK